MLATLPSARIAMGLNDLKILQMEPEQPRGVFPSNIYMLTQKAQMKEYLILPQVHVRIPELENFR